MPAVYLIFWGPLFLIIWTYFGYPGILWIVSKFKRFKRFNEEFHPGVSIIIAAYNEEARIREKIENTLSLSYPKEKLEIIVVSDGSSDKTEEFTRAFSNRGVRFLAFPERRGKHTAQHYGWEESSHDILVFSDATTFLPSDAVEKIVRNFADPKIGCVSSLDRMKSHDSNISGEGAYVKYEMLLRSLESDVSSLVGVSGCFYAVRKHLCEGWVDNMSSDFFVPILTHMKGSRTILDSEAIGYYEVLRESKMEFIRKVRTVVHGLEVLFRFKEILNPFKYGFYSFQMLNHKLSRWLVPLYLIFLFWGNLLLVQKGSFYNIFFMLQVVFYLLALAAFMFNSLNRIFIFKIPLFFVIVNYSILVAWHNFLIGKDFVKWEPTKR